ncbi:hypothetical protein CNMCM7691_004832 [Aspergillus felis]|uniref:Peptidase C14 caspase domain-containing protein n=1 Tax=Aspergillus felis TaxID=1287682 RepID=A0A8H6R5N0_9EURO|nr:hypothetical protein CNMCM7691_004832 [Aspergillus felis]
MAAKTPTRWALLIGVDYYFPGTERPINLRSLNGCVEDVTAAEALLKNRGVQHIVKLTASKATGKEGDPAIKEEDESLWPTRDNVIRELGRIFNSTEKGDLLYIHYSGHGMRRDRMGEPSDRSEGNQLSGAALVMTDVRRGGAYLTAYELGVWVKRMVKENNLRVTVILDSCYSGRGLRDEEDTTNLTARTPEEVDQTQLQSDRDSLVQALGLDDVNNDHGLATRDPEMRKSWLDNPTGCTVVTACGVNEKAHETHFGETSAPHGVLTHWILKTLCKYAPDAWLPTCGRIRDTVIGEIAKMVPLVSQTPTIHGQENHEFFGQHSLPRRPICKVIKHDLERDVVVLNIGRAQGVSLNAVYDVFSFGKDGEWDLRWVSSSSQAAEQVRVTKVFNFRCEAVPITTKENRSLALDEGSSAVLRTWALPSDYPVQLDDTVSDMSPSIRQTLDMYLRQTPGLFLLEGETTQEARFLVWLDTDRRFRIADENGSPLSRVPAIPMDDGDKNESPKSGVAKLASVLRHLARYLSVRDLRNRDPRTSLALGNFRCTVTNSDGEDVPKGPSGCYEVRESEVFYIEIKNVRLMRPVYVNLVCTAASWQIMKLNRLDESTGTEVWASEPYVHEMNMIIPETQKEDCQEGVYDLIKAFVYTGPHPPSWDELTLPKLPVDASAIAFHSTSDPVEPIISNLQKREGSFREPGPPLPSHAPEKWGVLEFWIHTTPK